LHYFLDTSAQNEENTAFLLCKVGSKRKMALGMRMIKRRVTAYVIHYLYDTYELVK